MSKTKTREFKDAAYRHLAIVGKALSSSTRLEMLAQAPRTVESLAGQVNQSVANTSQHLQKLKKAHLVTSEREGLHVTYALSGPDVGRLVGELNEVATSHLEGLEKLAAEFFDGRDGLEVVDQATLLERLRNDEVVLIDVRPREEFEAGHLPGARSVPVEEVEAHVQSLPRDRAIVAYCRGPYCTFSAKAVQVLREQGFEAFRSDVSVISGLL